MDILTSGNEKEFGLGAVARVMNDVPDLFSQAAEPIVLSPRRLRYPTGPASALRPSRAFLEEEPERWDGLY